jgi:hypothetical protein
MDRNFSYAVLVNVAAADLQGLCDKAGKATRKFAMRSDYRVNVRDEAVLFCFEDQTARVLFEMYCHENRVPHRRIED